MNAGASGYEGCSDAPLTRDYASGSVLKHSLRQLNFHGMWPLPGSWRFHAFSAIVFALGVGNFSQIALGVYSSWGDLQELTMAFSNTFTVFSGILKMTHFLRNRRRYCALVRLTDNLAASQQTHCEVDDGMAAISRDSLKVAYRLPLAVYAYIALLCVIWFPMPLIVEPHSQKLPFIQLHYWINRTGFPVYETSFLLQDISSFFFIFISTGLDCFFAVIMVHVTVQLKLLVYRISDIRLRDASTIADVSEVRHGYDDNEAHEAMYKELCLCIETHQKILGFVKYLESVMNPIALTQFVFSVLAACVTLFQETYNPDISAVFKCASYLPTPGAQVFLYCWGAHSIMEQVLASSATDCVPPLPSRQGEAVCAAAYNSSWFDADARFKRSMRILMCRAQKPLSLTAGRMYPISRATFVWLVNASYKYYALLRQLHSRDSQRS
ncbi:odorant receptor Or2-like [Schistocerca cancellata]|uniref:odorant receptor Or2-like n=1 Tax=Schistocerca cancellata TaxID=274614 RepID=UPI002119636E|nr:odorant receptor Or2-like [Schistocerca cancellata]